MDVSQIRAAIPVNDNSAGTRKLEPSVCGNVARVVHPPWPGLDSLVPSSLSKTITPILPKRPRYLVTIVLGFVCIFVVGLFAWMAAQSVTELTGMTAANNHYNLLVRGFQHGQLSLDKAAPPQLAELPDPYDPVANGRYRTGYGLHDMTYYKGRLYLYFGVAPALLLFWPWAALTGNYLFHHHAVAIFCAVGFLVSAGVLRSMWKRFFPEVSVAVVAAGMLALGLATGVPILLQRAEFWEVAVSCGCALSMLALAGIWQAVVDPGRRMWWVAAASLALGFAVGARPFLILVAPILLMPAIIAWNEASTTGRRRLPWDLLAAAVLPVSLCLVGLMIYNELRFGNPLEFGQTYQLAGDRQDNIQHFSLRFAWFNFCVYFLEPVRWTRDFPFATDIATPAVPAGHADIEDPFGILTNIPVVWFALAAPLAWWHRVGGDRARLRGFLAAVAVFFGICAGVLGLFYGTCSRYEAEFLPPLVLLAVVGILSVERALASHSRWRVAVRAVWVLLLAFSLGFNLLEGFDHYALQRCRLGNQLDAAGRFPDAIRQYQAALAVKGNYVDGHSSYGNVLRQVGRLPEAIAECQTALRLDPKYARAYNNLANALLDSGKINEAIEYYREALRLRPDDPKMHFNLGNAWLNSNRDADAIQEYLTALRLDPNDEEAHFNLGNVFLKDRRNDEAIAQFAISVQLKPDYAEARNNLGNALLEAGRTGQAIAQLQAAVRSRPDYAPAYNSLGAALFRAGRLREAIAEFATALRIKPDFVEARQNLERSLAELPADR
jgi:tetratricopeptide (TPR) repeat protein